MKSRKVKLTAQQQGELLEILETRFNKNSHRHKTIDWRTIQMRLKANPEKLRSLYEMETTGGEPDVTGYDKKTDTYTFCDCSPETPKGRRSICYDHEALESRKEHKPANSAVQMAIDMGIDLLTEDDYRQLQKLEKLDAKTSSWIKTPADIRKLGGALFCDYRFGHVFVYHNGAESYYAARGFRGKLEI